MGSELILGQLICALLRSIGIYLAKGIVLGFCGQWVLIWKRGCYKLMALSLHGSHFSGKWPTRFLWIWKLSWATENLCQKEYDYFSAGFWGSVENGAKGSLRVTLDDRRIHVLCLPSVNSKRDSQASDIFLSLVMNATCTLDIIIRYS